MAKYVLWIIVISLYMAIYNNYKHHIENSRFGMVTFLALICFIAIIEVVEKVNDK